jgi:flagellar basal-body rod modification protein FlgD
MGSTSTDSSVNTIGGVTTYEQAQQKSLYGTSGEQTLGKDTFLKLLTTQLQHQDPLNPMDNTQFVAQLSQFSSLEQLTDANKRLDNLAVGISSVGSATMVNLIGKEVRAVGNAFHFDGTVDGKLQTKDLHYKLDSQATSGTLTIYDSAGSVVLSTQIDPTQLAAGDNTFVWNGKNSKGLPCEAGTYTFSVSAVNDKASIGVTTYTQGFVDQIDFSSGAAAPRVDGQTLTVDKIVQILDDKT